MPEILKNERFIIQMQNGPCVESITSIQTGETLFACAEGLSITITAYNRNVSEYVHISGDSAQVHSAAYVISAQCVEYEISAAIESNETISMRVRASLEGDSFRLSLVDVVESGNWSLVMLRIPELVGAYEKECDSRIALPAHGGRLLNPAECEDFSMDHRYNWILDSFGSVAIAYKKRLTAVVQVLSMDDQLTSKTGSGTEGRFGVLGALLRHRYTRLDPSYRFRKPNADNDISRQLYPVTESFVLPDTPTVLIRLIEHDPVSPESGWIIGARAVYDSLPGKPSGYYRDRMVYKLFASSPNQDVATSFDQMLGVIKAVYERTGGAKQLAYIVGFQRDGHDTGYPDTFEVNERAGGQEGLDRLVDGSKELNAMISFHDNFDDVYMESSLWNDDIVARDNQGNLLRGGVWNGAQAYWTGIPYYTRTHAAERIQQTRKRYPWLKDTYHLDVLTASVFRLDFRLDAPTGRQQDLLGRLELIEMFRENGLDLTSEACGLPFVGSISYFWHMQRVPRACHPGDIRIPMVPFLVHGKADYSGTHTDSLHDILDGLLYGAFYGNDVTAATPVKELTDAYFMLQVPLNRLRDERAVDYCEQNGWKCVTYSDGSYVTVQHESLECRVFIDGEFWIYNGAAIIPDGEGWIVYVAYEDMSYSGVIWHPPVPEGTQLTFRPIGVLTDEIQMTMSADGIALLLPTGIAYRVRAADIS